MAMQIAAVFGIIEDKDIPSNAVATMSFITANCNSPFQLTQNCSFWDGADLNVAIGGMDLKIAATQSGDTILLMSGDHIKNMFASAFSLGISNAKSEASKKALEITTEFLENRGIKIQKITKLVSDGGIDGYFLETDGDAFSALKGYQPEESI